jgi:hypothetical protein
MNLPSLLGRVSTSLFLLAALAAPSPADDLFVASSNTVFARGNATSGGFQPLGACFGIPLSMVADGEDVYLGDALGRIYRYAGSTQNVSIHASTSTDGRAIALRSDQILMGGTSGLIQRIDKASGALVGSWQIQDDVTALLIVGNKLFAGSSSGRITVIDIPSGSVDTASFVCGGGVASLAADSTDLIVGITGGFILRMDIVTGFPNAFFSTGHDIKSIAVQGGSLLTAGSDGVIRRFNRVSGLPQGVLQWQFDVNAMALAVSNVGFGSCYGYDCPCNNPDPIGGCRNSTGVGCTLTGSGSRSVSADDLSLTATNMPSGSMGRMYMGAGTINVPFGDGLLCAGSGGYGQFRFPVQAAGPNGTFTLGPGIAQHSESHFSAPGRIVPGFTWHFQAWYRNTAGPCGSGFNTSNVFSVTFVP